MRSWPGRGQWVMGGLIALGLGLLGCSQHFTVGFKESEGLAVPAKVRAQVDPRLWELRERWETWSASGEVEVGQALHYVLEQDPAASGRLSYVTSRLSVSTGVGVGVSFYNPNTHQVSYNLTVTWARGERVSVLDSLGQGRSGTSSAAATEEAVQAAVLDLYRKVSALEAAGL
jgi:hypothetical protein